VGGLSASGYSNRLTEAKNRHHRQAPMAATSDASWSEVGSSITGIHDGHDGFESWDLLDRGSESGVANLSDLDDFAEVLSLPTTTVNYPPNEIWSGEDDGVDSVREEMNDDADSTVSGASTFCRCPLTLDIMRQPTLCEVDGRVYERASITAWVQENGTSPMTREVRL
jgi:hypothetical protein